MGLQWLLNGTSALQNATTAVTYIIFQVRERNAVELWFQ